MKRLLPLVIAALVAPAGLALAADSVYPLGQHPAVLVSARGQAPISSDANRYILGHPASPTWQLADESAASQANARVAQKVAERVLPAHETVALKQ